MKKIVFLVLTVVFTKLSIFAVGYNIGDNAMDFTLKNVDGKMVTLSDYAGEKGVVVIFTCNHCPYAIAYEDRIIAIHKKYAKLGMPVLAVNPNDEEIAPGDSFEGMVKRAKDKNFPFAYVRDKSQDVYKTYGATNTPHVFVLSKQNNEFIVSYIGTIDDNYQDASAVKKTYLASALDAVIAGKTPDPQKTKAIGCSIKTKKE